MQGLLTIRELYGLIMQKTNSDSNKSGNTGGLNNQFPLDLKLKF